MVNEKSSMTQINLLERLRTVVSEVSLVVSEFSPIFIYLHGGTVNRIPCLTYYFEMTYYCS